MPTSCLRRVAVNMVTTGKIGSERNQSCTSMSEMAMFRQLSLRPVLRGKVNTAICPVAADYLA
jgi:hypothetical protein